jgi:hypothetical protein
MARAPRKALQHRWWNRNTKKGKPVGFSRIRTLGALLKSGFGMKVKRSKDGNAYVLRVKAWGEAVHLMEKGRKKAQVIRRKNNTQYTTSNQYRGWFRGFQILRNSQTLQCNASQHRDAQSNRNSGCVLRHVDAGVKPA